MLHTKCLSPFFAHDGVSDAAAEPKPDTACSVRPSMPLGGGGVWSPSPSIWTSRGGRDRSSKRGGRQRLGAHDGEKAVKNSLESARVREGGNGETRREAARSTTGAGAAAKLYCKHSEKTATLKTSLISSMKRQLPQQREAAAAALAR